MVGVNFRSVVPRALCCFLSAGQASFVLVLDWGVSGSGTASVGNDLQDALITME